MARQLPSVSGSFSATLKPDDAANLIWGDDMQDEVEIMLYGPKDLPWWRAAGWYVWHWLVLGATRGFVRTEWPQESVFVGKGHFIERRTTLDGDDSYRVDVVWEGRSDGG